MTDDLLTAQQRLAISRRALLDQLQGRSQPAAHVNQAAPRLAGLLDHFAWSAVARKVVQRWWRRHPANAVGQVARPLLERYAREQPAKLMTLAATVGAVAVLIRPWRLLSVTAIVAALLKTSDVADVVTTLMHKTASPPKG